MTAFNFINALKPDGPKDTFNDMAMAITNKQPMEGPRPRINSCPLEMTSLQIRDSKNYHSNTS